MKGKVFINCFLIFLSSYLYAQEAKEIVAAIGRKIENINSYQADFNMAFVQKDGSIMEMEGKICFAKPDKMRMELSMKGVSGVKQLMVSDGNTLWQYMPFMKIATKVDLASLRDEFGPQLNLIKKQSKIKDALSGIDQTSLKFIGIEKKDGVDCYLLEGKVSQNRRQELSLPLKITKAKIWIGKDDGLQRKAEFYDQSGELIFYQELKNVHTNVNIPDHFFQFTPPKDVNILDSTPSARQMLKREQKK